MTKDKAGKASAHTSPAHPAAEAASGSSPVCYAHEMAPAYAGYLPDAEVIALLDTLLEGERAGDRLAQDFLKASPNGAATVLLEAVRRDEARFAAMLARLIQHLGAAPSPRVGTFYEKAMAIEGFSERLAFLNRGQASVVRKLCQALPRIKDDRIHAALKGMLGAHETNIARCEALIATLARS
ncbi:MAG: DUF6306 domain-containing protein [Alphaproteobacteria bacterium]